MEKIVRNPSTCRVFRLLLVRDKYLARITFVFRFQCCKASSKTVWSPAIFPLDVQSRMALDHHHFPPCVTTSPSPHGHTPRDELPERGTLGPTRSGLAIERTRAHTTWALSLDSRESFGFSQVPTLTHSRMGFTGAPPIVMIISEQLRSEVRMLNSGYARVN